MKKIITIALMSVAAIKAPANPLKLNTPIGRLTASESFGVNIHFTTPRPDEMRLLANAGFKWVRMDFVWSATERERGKYDFREYDKLMSKLDEYGIRAMFILDYANPLYDDGLAPHTDAGRAAFARWAAAAVAQFKNRGVLWEIWNEPNSPSFWRPKPDAKELALLACEVGKAIRRVSPSESYCGPALWRMDMKFLETCFQNGVLKYWDAVTVHPYRNSAPETVLSDYAKLGALINKYAPPGKQIPIISGEWGYTCAEMDEDRQGQYLPRQFLVNLLAGVPVSIWYDWHDDGVNPTNGEHHFGVVRNNYAQKPAYRAIQTLATNLNGFRLEKRVENGNADDYVLLFRKNDQYKCVAWTSGEPHTISVFGQQLSLTGSPQYFVPDISKR
jgi:polysaccharide biosynthesis protein PslG